MSRKHIILIIICSLLFPLGSFSSIPVTGQRAEPGTAESRLPLFFPAAQEGLPPEDGGQPLIRVKAEGVFSLPVVQQPANNPGYVASLPSTLTQFALAGRYGTTALMAHNHQAGAEFFKLQPGDRVDLQLKNHGKESYWVTSIRTFQAVNPTSPYSDFIDLENGNRLSASELFLAVYGPGDRLVFQTCLAKNGDQSWGRYFVIALPIPEKFFQQSLVSFPSLTNHAVQ